MEINKARILDNLFWVDAKSRRAYGYFGDVNVLNTTFNIDVYGMMFAPLFGVNNHGETMVLCCGFLKNEKIKSFDCLFDEFP